MDTSYSGKPLARHPKFKYKISRASDGTRLPAKSWLHQRIRDLQDEIALREAQLQEHLLPDEGEQQ